MRVRIIGMSNLNVPGLDLAAPTCEVSASCARGARACSRAPTPRQERRTRWRSPRRSGATEADAACRERRRSSRQRARPAHDAAFVDRLTLTPKTIAGDGRRPGANRGAAAIPSARSASLRYRPTGIQVGKMRVPLGVIGIIYESRPNVTADARRRCASSPATPASCAADRRRSACNQAIAACVHEGLPPQACRKPRCRWSPPPIAPRSD